MSTEKPDNDPDSLRTRLHYDYQYMWNDLAVGVRNRKLNTPDHPFTYVLDSWGNGESSPQFSLGFFGDHGMIRVDFYYSEDSPTVFVGSEIYSQGFDGNMRGQGRHTFENAQRIIQEISNMLGTSLVHIVITHSQSAALPSGAEYQLIDTEESYSQLKEVLPKGLGKLLHSPAETDGRVFAWVKKFDPNHHDVPDYPFLDEERQKIRWMTKHLVEHATHSLPKMP